MQHTFHTCIIFVFPSWSFHIVMKISVFASINLISLLLEYTNSWLRKDGRQQRAESLCFWQVRWSWRCVSSIYINFRKQNCSLSWCDVWPGGVFGGLVIMRLEPVGIHRAIDSSQVKRLSTLVNFPWVIHYSNFLVKKLTSVIFSQKSEFWNIFFYFCGNNYLKMLICVHS